MHWKGTLIALGLFVIGSNLYDYGLIGVWPAMLLSLVGLVVLAASTPALRRHWRLLWLVSKFAKFF